MTEALKEYIVVGKVGAPYGIKGWVKVLSFTESYADIFRYDPLYLEDKNGYSPIKIVDTRENGKKLIAKFVGYDTPEEVRILTGKAIHIKQSQLAPLKKNEYYWRDLEGLTVINHDGKVLGKILYLIETGTHDVLIVKSKKEHAIPYLPGKVVISVDLANKTMHVHWEEI